MIATLKKQGNSKGITIPAAILDALGWKEGMQLDLEVKDGRLVAHPLAPSLDALLATIPENFQTEEEDWGHDTGEEIVK